MAGAPSMRESELHAATHMALTEQLLGIRVNETDAAIRGRLAAAVSGGYDLADTLHNIYLDYGYPQTLDFYNYWNMYRRFGVAKRVVEAYPDYTWLDDPEIEAPEAFLRELGSIVTRLGLWRRLKGLDTRQCVGRYAGMFMRVRDNLPPNMPLVKAAGAGALVDMVPLYESQLSVVRVQEDVKADDYGMPVMYSYSSAAIGNRNERSASTFEIHPSRIVIAAEGSDGSGIYGISRLECVYNSLMDLRKIIGGGGEGYYKNAAQSVVFNLKDTASALQNKTLLDRFNEQYDDFAKSRFRRAMWAPGMDPTVLSSTLTNPKEFAENALMDIAAGSEIPMTLLMGTQTGRLAGDQDTRGFLANVQARRLDFGTDLARSMLNWMIKHGVLPAAAYEVEWPDIQSPSAAERLDNASKMADTNLKQFQSGGMAVFTGDEIRKEAGFEELAAEELPDETIDSEVSND